MAHITGAFRLGKDAELRYIPSGEAVASLALAFNYGQKGEEGKRPTQWVEASLWGKRAEALSEYLVKGAQISAVLSDPHIETYEGRNGPGHKMVARVLDLELVGSRPQSDGQQAQPAQRQQAPQRQAAPQQRQPQRTAPPPSTGSGFDDFEDSDVPF